MSLSSSPKWKEISGVLNLLEIKGYIDKENKLTPLGENLVIDLQPAPVIEIVTGKVPVFTQWIQDVHKKIQVRLIELTGRKQKMLGGKYAFLCNAKDLEKKLKSVISKHALVDYPLIEKILLRYVSKCNQARWEYMQLMEYYIEKDGVSKMVTDMDSADDTPIIQPINNNTIDI